MLCSSSCCSAGGPGIAGSHWESRIFQYEIMDGQAGNNMDFERHVVSRLTLALLEDSGWYVPTWSAAQTLTLGRHAGCEFVEHDCRKPTAVQQEFYCTTKQDLCVWDRTAQGTCDTDYFLMDNCAYTRPYLNTVCTNSSQLPLSAIAWGQNHGPQSRCLEHDTSAVFIRESVGVLKPPALGCYDMVCDWLGSAVFLKLFGNYVKCPAGELLQLENVDGLDFLSGSVGPCPEPESLCPGLSCRDGCNLNGRCVDGVCECYLGFSGELCSVNTCNDETCGEDEFCDVASGLCKRLGGQPVWSSTPSGSVPESATDQDRLAASSSSSPVPPGRVRLSTGEWVEYLEAVHNPDDDLDIISVANSDTTTAGHHPLLDTLRGTAEQSEPMDRLSLIIAALLGGLCAVLGTALVILVRCHLKRHRRRSRDTQQSQEPPPGVMAHASASGSSTRPGPVQGNAATRYKVESTRGTSDWDTGGNKRARSLDSSPHGSSRIGSPAAVPMYAAELVSSPELYSMPCPPQGCLHGNHGACGHRAARADISDEHHHGDVPAGPSQLCLSSWSLPQPNLELCSSDEEGLSQTSEADEETGDAMAAK